MIREFKRRKKELFSKFLKGEINAIGEEYSNLIDEYFRNTFLADLRSPYAIIALGGYGRKEMCLFSDVDVVFLFKDKIGEDSERIIQDVIYPLWNIKMDIGYSIHNIEEYIDLIKDDHREFTSALDARFICGQPQIYFDFVDIFRKRILAKSKDKIIADLIKKGEERHYKYGDSSYMLEPHLKEGKGGLRDYHTMRWIAKLSSPVDSIIDLEIYGYLPHKGYEALLNILAFLWRVRNYLHYVSKKKNDRLYMEYQKRIAKMMGFRREDGKKLVEVFLNELHQKMDILKDMYISFLIEHTSKKKEKRIKENTIEEIEIRDNLLYFRSSEDILRNPHLLIKIFEESQRLDIPLSAEAKALVKDFLFLVDENFRKSKDVIRSFERILLSPQSVHDVLEDMVYSGLLQRLIPPFEGIVSRIQYDEYHIYPVDKHSLQTLKNVKGFENSKDPLYSRIYKEIKDKRPLLFASLLHDVGKQFRTANHSRKGALVAEKVLRQFGYDEKIIEEVKFLIENHLFLIKTATRRDITDEETAIYCVQNIGNIQRLKELYLLSVADSMATGPSIWNDWTEELLRNLFLKVLNIMERGEIASKESLRIIEEKKKEISSYIEPSLKELVNYMSPRYLLNVSEEEIKRHIELYKKLNDNPFVWEIAGNSTPDVRTITICAHDRPGLFSKIAGVLTLNNIDILEAQVFTWRNNIALDIIKVRPPLDRILEDERWEKVKKDLEDAIQDKLDIETAIKKKSSFYRPKIRPLSKRPKKVVIDNRTSSFFTIIEVHASDFMGLLYRITNAIFKCGLDIWFAKLATKVDQVVDIFYVRDLDGQKISDQKYIKKIKSEIDKVI